MNKSKHNLELTSGVMSILIGVGSLLIGGIVALFGPLISLFLFGLLDVWAGTSIAGDGTVICLITGGILIVVVGIPMLICGIMLCQNPKKKDGSISKHIGRVVVTMLLNGLYVLAFGVLTFVAPPLLVFAILPAIICLCLFISLFKKHTQPAKTETQTQTLANTTDNVSAGVADAKVGSTDADATVIEINDAENSGPEIK